MNHLNGELISLLVQVIPHNRVFDLQVEIGGSSVLSRGTKLTHLFDLLFRRTGSQHPLVAGALGMHIPVS